MPISKFLADVPPPLVTVTRNMELLLIPMVSGPYVLTRMAGAESSMVGLLCAADAIGLLSTLRGVVFRSGNVFLLDDGLGLESEIILGGDLRSVPLLPVVMREVSSPKERPKETVWAGGEKEVSADDFKLVGLVVSTKVVEGTPKLAFF